MIITIVRNASDKYKYQILSINVADIQAIEKGQYTERRGSHHFWLIRMNGSNMNPYYLESETEYKQVMAAWQAYHNR